MIKSIKISKSIFVVALLFSAIYLPLDYTNKPTTYIYEPVTQSNIKPSTKLENYTVKEHNGKISVFQNGESEPIYSLDSPFVRDLPEYDQQLLTKGIKADTKEQLTIILEDYDN